VYKELANTVYGMCCAVSILGLVVIACPRRITLTLGDDEKPGLGN
jgi:hypothetical protein